MRHDDGELLARAHRRMLAHLGPQNWWPGESPFEVVVGAVLTQNTAWSRVVLALENLRREGLLDARSLNAVPEDHLATLLRPAGTYRRKAGYLRELLRWLVDGHDGSVERALDGDTASRREELLRLRGIGRETADSILLYAGGHPVFVVDAYTRRIFSRHGMIDPASDYDAIRAWFMERLPRDAALVNELHAQIVAVGKAHCRPRSPRCSECPLAFLFEESPASPPADAK
ncbi:MAG: endonuclease III domain-containing protein [Planctomycetota bacterium]|jgi:endonuclease-3 related protein